MHILAFPEYLEQGRALAGQLGVDCDPVQVHRFPDGESLITLPPALPAEVVLCRSLDRPNEKLVELVLAAQGARAQGARRLVLVAPYLCYMRQDTAFAPGQVVSQRVIGALLAAHFDALLTVDPHLHRTRSLAQAVPARRTLALSSAALMSRFLEARGERPLLVGPDRESGQWVSAVAAPAGLEWRLASKHRRGDREVEVRLPPGDLEGRDVVLVDDVASTGHTLARAAEALLARGAWRVRALVTHALFAEGALEELAGAGIETVWSTDSIPHPTNALALAPLLAEGLRSLEQGRG